MNKRQAKKIFDARRDRPDSPRIAFERLDSGDWPWNKQTWETASRVWWLYMNVEIRKLGIDDGKQLINSLLKLMFYLDKTPFLLSDDVCMIY